MKIQIINGPNLNLLGTREPEIYGNESFIDYLEDLKEMFQEMQIEYFQSNIEGEIIEKLHEVGFNYDGIIINAGGYTHTSVVIADAISSITTPVVEVHISNLLQRESFRHTSLLAKKCAGSIMGFGLESYRLALEYYKKKNEV